MKSISINDPLTAFQYRGTKESRDRMLEMDFCHVCVFVEETEGAWVCDRRGYRRYAGPGDWIIVNKGVIVDVLDTYEFEETYTIEDEG